MIERVAILGAGVMGSEIAQATASGGVSVVLLDSDPDALARGAKHIASIGERRVARGRMSPEDAEAIVGRVTLTEHDGDLASCDLAIEAVPEIIEIKREVFRRLDAALPESALIASNTSGLSITQLAEEIRRPERVLGLHFFNPASVMKLVEVVRGETTSEQTVSAGEAFASALGKTPVRVEECPGFLVNRILLRALAEAYRHAGESQTERAAADAAVKEQGPAPMGPFALGDLIGLDTLGHIRTYLEDAYGERFADGGAIDEQIAAGRLGAKTGAGFYEGEGPPEAADPSAGAGAAERYYEGALDEARRCVEEGIASSEGTDLAMRNGCGWSEGPLERAGDSRPVGQP